MKIDDSIFYFLSHLSIHFILCSWKSLKYIPSHNHLVKICKRNYVNFKIGQKWGVATTFSIHNVSSILTEFKQHELKKTIEKKQPWTLDYTLVLLTASFALSFFFFSFVWINWFPSKMMPCKLNHNLICLDLYPCLKDLRPI